MYVPFQTLTNAVRLKPNTEQMPSKCHANASFNNIQVSYNCSCNPNFVGDGFICEGKFVFFLFFKKDVR